MRLLNEPGEKSAIEGQAAGGFAGGPIVRDRAFYFGSVEHTARDTEDIITSPVLHLFRPEAPTHVPVTFREPQVLGRADINLPRRQTLAFRYRLDRIAETNQTADGGPSGLIAPERRHDATRRDQDAALFANRVLGRSAFNEIRFQFARRYVDQDVSAPGYSTGSAENHNGILLGQAPVVPAWRREDRWQLLGAITWLVPDARGDHAFKTGIDVSIIRGELFSPAGFQGIYRFRGDVPFVATDSTTYPASLTVNQGDPFSRSASESYAWFFEDAWKLGSRITMNLGLRWEYEHAVAVATDHDNVAPRLGVAFKPWARRQTVLRGGYGIYYDAVLARALNNGQSDFENRMITNPGFEDPPGPNLLARLAAVPPTVNRLPGVIRTPYSAAGHRWRLVQPVGTFTISGDLAWAQGYNLLRTRDLNYPDLDNPDRPRPDKDFARIRVRETEGHSWYRALLVGLEKRYGHRHSYGIAYTFSRSERDTEDWEFLPNDQRDYAAERGPASNDVRHRFVANLIVDLPFGVRLGTIFTAAERAALQHHCGWQ